jgi:hypothetical protein
MRENLSAFLCLLLFLPLSDLLSAGAAVSRLQDSFDARPAERRQIYTEVIGLVDRAGAAADSAELLARAVALEQRAMDAEDEFIGRLVSSAPGFAGLSWSAPPFLADYARAARELGILSSRFPFVQPCAESAKIVSEQWRDGPALLTAARDHRSKYPMSRFGKRLLLLAGCRLAIERNYRLAAEAFAPIWSESPTSGQAVDAYRLADGLKGSRQLELTPEQMLDWGRGLGMSGNAIFTRLIERFPASRAAQQAYLEMFRNISRGFPARLLSLNFKLADRLDREFSSFIRAYPNSEFLPEILLVCADFHYQCGKKSMSIARKNDNSNKQSRRRQNQKFSADARKHFQRVGYLDSLATARFPGKSWYFQTGILSALTMIEMDQFDRALAELTTLAVQNPDSESVNQIYWYIGLTNYLKEDYQTVVKRLLPLEKDGYRDATFWSRAMLFLGKSCLFTGDSLAAARVFSILSRAYPYTYYGIRARYLKNGLGRMGSGEGSIDSSAKEAPRFPAAYTPEGALSRQEAEKWQALGFYAEASYVYSYALSVVPEDRLLRYRLHENYFLAGWYHRVLRQFRGPFRDYLERGGTGLPENFWKLAYLNPEPFFKLIVEEGAKRNIPPALITAVIRQESNFHPRAKSHAGAVGLMQILPSVSRRLSRGAGLGPVNARSLLEPRVNIALGTKYLASSLARHNGNITLAISSYNADPRNLPAWIERSHGEREGRFDLDLFVELIPLEETYDYNLQVLTNFWRYQEVYGNGGELFRWKLSPFAGR